MSVIGSNILAGASGQGGYFIDRSLRLRSSASAYLSRTFGAPTNSAKWTFSRWLKRGAIGARQSLFAAGSGGSSYANIEFKSDDTIQFLSENSSIQFQLVTTQVFRDPSAWYNIHIIYDSANATSTDRIQLWVNGVRVTAFSTATYPSAPNNLFNTAIAHQIGVLGYGSVAYFDGYLTEVNFIDGQALNPTSFGEYNEDTGVWQPIKYTGTYGTNGFYLNFSDNSTTTTLGYDTSGNSNNWTANNISVTSGVTYDSMTDVPTLTSTDAANYAVMNPLAKDGGTTLSDANLKISSVNYGNNTATMFLTNGKWYWEAQGDGYVGAVCGQEGQNWSTSLSATGSKSIGYYINGTVYWDGGNNGGGLSTYGTSDVIGVAVDMAAGTVAFYKNGSLEYTATFGSGTVPDLSAGVFPCYNNGSSSSTAKLVTFNFGQRPFAYTPPAGFKSLNTYNLPDSTIEDGSEYFNAVTYTGNTSGASVTGVGFQPDFVWTKNRDVSNNHELIDAVRGGSSALFSNLTNQEATQQRISSFDSDGWTYTTNSNSALANPYVGWTWKANGSGVTDNEGTIESTVSANPTAGFSIVTYTGNGTPGATIGHGLGVKPAMMIAKNRSSGGSASYEWTIYHTSLGATKAVFFDTGAAATDAGYWYNTEPTSTLITVPSNTRTNVSGSNFVIYCFADVEGYSKFGSYTGNGSATGDGPFVYLGFRPAFVMIKSTSSGGWSITDTSRDTYNLTINKIEANSALSEAGNAGLYQFDVLSNGFKLRQGAGTGANNSSQTYIYMAFAENPTKYALAR